MTNRSCKKFRIVSIVMLLFLVLSGCVKQETIKENLVNDLKSLADIKDFNELTVQVSYISPWFNPRERYTVEDLKAHTLEKHIKLEGNTIEQGLELFSELQIKDIELSSKKSSDLMRFYVLIKSNEETLLELKLFGGFSTYTLNGVQIKPNTKILEAIIPLLTEDALLDLEVYRDRDCEC